MKMLHAVIQYKGQEYDVYGLERIEPIAGHKKGLFFYFQDKMGGLYTQCVHNAKIITVSLCGEPNDLTKESTKQALGFIRF